MSNQRRFPIEERLSRVEAVVGADRATGLLSLIRSVESDLELCEDSISDLEDEIRGLRSVVRNRVMALEGRVRELEGRGADPVTRLPS
jgi:hypothetical protein